MSIPLAVGMILQVRIVSNQANDVQAAFNILHYRVANVAGLSASDLQAATALDTAVHTAYANWLANTASYRGVGVKIIKPSQYIEQAVTANGSPGNSGATVCPTQVSGLITLNTLLAGKANRGRIYVPYPAIQSLTVNGELSAGGVTLLAAIGTALPFSAVIGTAPNTATIQWCLYHRASGTTTDITAITTQSKLATQRRRGDYGRHNALPF